MKLDKITTQGMQVRASMSEDVVSEYMEALQDGAEFPPLSCVFDGTTYWLTDGFHRLEAYRRAGKHEVPVSITNGSHGDALKLALGANISHGLRRTNEDKRKAVKVAWENCVELGLGENPSARLIADLCGVHHTFAQNQLATVATCVQQYAPKTGRDGKSYPVPPPRPPKREPSEPIAPKADTKPAKVRVLDALNNIIPDNIIPIWESREDVSEAAELLRQARLAIKQAQDDKNPAWAGLNFSSTLMHLDNALIQVKGSVPHCVCPYCHGLGCHACACVGMMTKFQYSNVPSEMKK
jgi:uncharacterized ParB-like nuclease family protein